MHVAPDDFQYVSQELLAGYVTDEGQAFAPCELGAFAEDIWQ